MSNATGPRILLADDVAGLLELVASEQPSLLRPLVNTLEYSRAAAGVADLVELWGIGPENRAADLAELAVKTSAHLDQLQRRRGFGWRHPREVIPDSNVAALLAFTYGRRGRIQDLRRRQRLKLIGRKLERAAEKDRQRLELDRFMSEPPRRPIDAEWIRAFVRGER